jgi:predicted Zn-dependent protease
VTGGSSRQGTPQELVERALEHARAGQADGCVVLVTESSEANLRWANNTLTTNGTMRDRTVTVISTVDGGTGAAAAGLSRTGVDLDTLADLVAASERAAREAGPAEDAQPLLTPGQTVPAGDWDAPPAETGIGVFRELAPALGAGFEEARAEGRKLFGFAHHTMGTLYLGTSTGVRLRHDQPTGSLELNAKSDDMARSAWGGVSTRDFTDVDLGALQADLAVRLDWAKRTVDLPAGRYETLLPPTAVADLFIYLLGAASARDAHEGRSVFGKPGGGTRVGERLSGDAVPLSILSDPAEPGLGCVPFVAATASGDTSSVFDNGLPIGRTEWVRDGELASLMTTRHTAGLTGLPLASQPDNLVITAGTGSGRSGGLPELIAGTERGLLVTCLWYIREVDPQTLLLTGLTRDGVYLVEHGEVTGAVNNFRFNESPVDILRRVVQASTPERALPREWGDYFTRAAVPALRVADFNMSTVSQAS